MSEGFPLLTTKKMPFKTIVTELLWFLRGDTNIKFLVDNNCHIWDGDAFKNFMTKSEGDPDVIWNQEQFINKIKTDDEFAGDWGGLGKIYGFQWRNWGKKNVINYDLENVKSSDKVKVMDLIRDGGDYSKYDVKVTYQNNSIDQIANLINDLKTNPDSRRLMVNAWNVGELDQMVLPPCHYGFQVYTRELSLEERHQLALPIWKEKYGPLADMMVPTNVDNTPYKIPTRAISLMFNMRSVDTFLGLPFNIASYGLLLEIIAKEVNMAPDELIGNLGDVHLYSNHIEQAKEQIGRKYTHEERTELLKQAMGEERYDKAVDELMPFGGGLSEYYDSYKIPYTTREPYRLPTLVMVTNPDLKFDEYVYDNLKLVNYQSHPTIKAPLSN
jgi:thymidylate synthase